MITEPATILNSGTGAVPTVEDEKIRNLKLTKSGTVVMSSVETEGKIFLDVLSSSSS